MGGMLLEILLINPTVPAVVQAAKTSPNIYSYYLSLSKARQRLGVEGILMPRLAQSPNLVRYFIDTSNNSIMFNQVHQVYQPHPALKEFINNIVIQKVKLDPSKPKPVFIMPPIQEQAVFFYPFDLVHLELSSSHKLIELPRSVVVARRINRLNVVMGYNHLVIKVGFQPGELFRLLGIPMSEFEPDHKIYESVCFDKDIPLIVEQLNESASFEHMVVILQKWLLGKLHHLKKELPIDRALPFILKKGILSNITEVASQSCVSIRQLERLFQQRIGLSPQFYARLVRFTKAWIVKENNPAINWTKLAYECGYFDQMHLIRDFKEFTGVNPSLIQKDLLNLPVSLQHEVFH